jgi:2-polyprenyl-3-methyl-5-hydroxy-6-metoxy-1,4-benzoquinol methylase
VDPSVESRFIGVKMIQSNPEHCYKEGGYTYSHSYLLPIFNDLLKNCPGKNVLELGCGNGAFCNFLHKKGYDVVGVDISESGIEIATKAYPNIKFIRFDICDLEDSREIKKGTFDVVVAMEVIEHMAYPRELIRLAKIYLKQGRLFFDLYSLSWICQKSSNFLN